MGVKDYIRERFFPHLWCPGSGHGIVLNGLLRAFDRLGMSRNEIVMVSGIGCSSRISGYLDFHTLHTIHGRALAFAAGVKLSRPELNLIEGLWGYLKRSALNNYFYGTIDSLEEAIYEAFAELQQHPETALSLAYKTSTNLRKTA